MNLTRITASFFTGALFFFSFGTHARETDLVALGCYPESPNLRQPKDADTYHTAPRERYVFMWKQPDGDISKLCIDELGTDATQSVTCTLGDGVSSGASEVSTRSLAGFRRLIIYRADASMWTELHSRETYKYRCAPSKDPEKVLRFISEEKQKQKSSNVF